MSPPLELRKAVHLPFFSKYRLCRLSPRPGAHEAFEEVYGEILLTKIKNIRGLEDEH